MNYRQRLKNLRLQMVSELAQKSVTLFSRELSEETEDQIEKLPYVMEQDYDYQVVYYIVAIHGREIVCVETDYYRQVRRDINTMSTHELANVLDFINDFEKN